MSRAPNEELITGFIEEVQTYIPALTKSIAALRKSPAQRSVLDEIHRLVHIIKGASSMVGISGLSHIAGFMEAALEEMLAGRLAPAEEALAVMTRTVEIYQTYCSGLLGKATIDEPAMLAETVSAYSELQSRAIGPNGAVAKAYEPAASAMQADPPATDLAQYLETSKGSAGSNIMPELLGLFHEEAEEHLEALNRSLNSLESQIQGPVSISSAHSEEIRRIKRSVHTLKGAAAVIGLQIFAEWAHKVEDFLDWLYETAQQITPQAVALLTESTDLLAQIIANPQAAGTSKLHTVIEQFEKIMEPTAAPEIKQPDPIEPTENMAESADALATCAEAVGAASLEPVVEENAKTTTLDDVAENTIENVPLGFTQTLRVDKVRVDDLVNLAGELMIASSAFDQKMEFFKAAVNELEFSRNRLKEIAHDLEVGYEVKALNRRASAHPDPGFHTQAKQMQGQATAFDAIEMDQYSELNRLIRSMNECAIDVGAINTQFAIINSDFEGHFHRQQVLLSELQHKMMRIRMNPMSIIANKLRQTVREVAGVTNKKVRLLVEGESIELDRLIWEKITDPLMHLLRNAVAHGIESAAQRRAAGKPPVAMVKLAASREGNQVIIRISDDGGGLDYEAIKATALKMKISDRVDQMSEDQLAALIFVPGFTTSQAISQVSGRGVGMDVVKENIQELQGLISVVSRPREGTQFTIRIPLTLAVVRALMLTSGSQEFATALNDISEITRVDAADIIQPSRDAVRIGDEVLPLFHLTQLLGLENSEHNSRDRQNRDHGKQNATVVQSSAHPLVLVVASGSRRAALVIDSIVGQREIVIKNLGSHLHYVKGISGATILGDGRIVPILNIEELLWSTDAGAEDLAHFQARLPEKPLEIMVVDDSVSIRQVVCRLIESQGWKATPVKDGLDVLERLGDIHPDLIVLDIEMPRMNGFELLSMLKADPRTKNLPVVMLSSRTASKHREKAMALGANGYIAKPYKDDDFIDLILDLTGGSSQQRQGHDDTLANEVVCG